MTSAENLDATPTAPQAPIRLAVVDDHRMLLAALGQWIGAASNSIDLVIAVPTWDELLSHPDFPVDVVLLDLDLKDNIPVAVKLATLKATSVPVVLMSTYSDPNLVREALAAGAMGYLVKSEDASLIVEAIEAAYNGDAYISQELDQALAGGPGREAPHLTPQERRVMGLYSEGFALKDVAEQLDISPETAKSYLKRIREKYRLSGINVGTKVALRRRAVTDGIITEHSVRPEGSE